MNRRNKRPNHGFTLVELMIVVFIIGILGAVAIPGYRRYINQARSAEAPRQLEKMWSGAVSYYMADHSDATTSTIAKQFPGDVSVDPEPGCCTYPNKTCPGSHPEYRNPTWTALNFNMPDPHKYIPLYWRWIAGGFEQVRMEVRGDLDCDTTPSVFMMSGTISPTSGDPMRRGGGMFVVKADE